MMPRHLYTPQEWQEMASFVLPRGTVANAIQGERTIQRIKDLGAIHRVTRVTPAVRAAAVRSMRYEELVDEQTVDRHREAQTGDHRDDE